MPAVKIVITPNPILRQVSRPVVDLNKKILGAIRNVEDTLRESDHPKGVGLSTIQIGKPIRVFASFLPPSGNPEDKTPPKIKTFINPEILEASKKKTLGPDQEKHILEGCLSIPEIWAPVWRHQWIKLKYWTLEVGRWTLTEHRERFSDFHARVIQHEIDHLNGILFTDHSLRDHLPLYKAEDNELVKIPIT